MISEDADALRCAVHPSLPSYDTCPVCRRPRCAADAQAAPGGGCVACQGVRARKGPPPLDLRALVGAGVVCGLVTPVAGLISSEYVAAGVVGLAAPLFVGVVLGIAAEAGARKKRGRALRLMAVLYAVLAIATGLDQPLAIGSAFRMGYMAEVGGVSYPAVPVSYLLAGVGAWLWTAPPRVVKKPDETA